MGVNVAAVAVAGPGARRESLFLNEREVDRFGAVWIHLAFARHFETVDVECGAPMGQIAADLRNVGRKAGKKELQFEERRPGSARSVLIAVGDTRAFLVRSRIAECHRHPESDEVFKRLMRFSKDCVAGRGRSRGDVNSHWTLSPERGAVEMKPIPGSSWPI